MAWGIIDAGPLAFFPDERFINAADEVQGNHVEGVMLPEQTLSPPHLDLAADKLRKLSQVYRLDLVHLVPPLCFALLFVVALPREEIAVELLAQPTEEPVSVLIVVQ